MSAIKDSPDSPQYASYDSSRFFNEISPALASGFSTSTTSTKAAISRETTPHNWVPDPDDPRRARTLVLCFDGTGDQFDDDVSSFTHCIRLLFINFSLEFQCRPVSVLPQEGQSG